VHFVCSYYIGLSFQFINPTLSTQSDTYFGSRHFLDADCVSCSHFSAGKVGLIKWILHHARYVKY